MKKRFYFLITFPVLAILGSTLFFLFLPFLFDLYLFPRLIAELPFTEKELSISRLSPWKIRGTLTLADEDRPTLTVPRFELYYTPASLLRGKIAGLLLDSASLQVEMQNGHPVIRGLPIADSTTMQEDNTSPFLLPLAVKTIILKNCTITLQKALQKPINFIFGGRFSLGFLEQAENKKLLSTLSGQVQVGGDVTLSGELGLESLANGYEAHLQLQSPDIGQLTALFPVLKDTHLTGSLSLRGRVNLDPLTRQVTGYEATVKLPGFRLSNNNVIFEKNSAEKPITLQLAGNPEKTRYTLSDVVLAQPEKGSLDFEGEIEIPNGRFNGIGHLLFNRTNSTVKLRYNGATDQSGTNLSYHLAGDAFTLEEILSVSGFTGEGDIEMKGATFTGTLNSRIPEITFKKEKTTLTDLSLRLPFQYPPQPASKSTAGELTIEEIHHQGTNSGRFRATLRPSLEKVAFSTLFTTPFVPGLQLTCDGSARMPADISVKCRAPETQLNSSTFPKFIPLPKNLSFTGNFAAVGEFHIANKVPAGKLTIDYRDGTLTHGENKLSDINLGVVFPHLPLLQSSPGQLCTIGSLDFGKIQLSDARIRFRIEDEQSIFLERSRLSWCGGKVETGSFTLSRDMKELETTLYCDRLRFTELLAQFGIDQTEGQGSLNGKLPILISNHGIIFDDGFLFSTPGNSGIVRFNDTKQLRQGMPDLGSSPYLDYSMKALENFSYNWTKLSFNSLEDDLLITMQLDGKPAEPLPFGYKKGQIVPSNRGPGLQHPIRLDVNFRLPLQDLFQYGKNIQSIMENM